jgi:hypothetical protein
MCVVIGVNSLIIGSVYWDCITFRFDGWLIFFVHSIYTTVVDLIFFADIKLF